VPLPITSTPKYRVTGSGPPLVYVPGLDGSGELLFKQTPDLARFFRVVSYRLRETGEFSYQDLTDDLASVIEGACAGRATIVAESFGGTVALSFALRYPSMIERLVIVNSFPRYPGRIRLWLATRLASILPSGLTMIARVIADSLGLIIDRVEPLVRERFVEVIKGVRLEGYRRRLRLIEEFDVEDRLGEIKTPTLLLAGDRDLVVPSVRAARMMSRRMPNATVKVVRGGGHALLLGARLRLADFLEVDGL
jgi:pimeloyl-ACP methyl ester carboxylesterase